MKNDRKRKWKRRGTLSLSPFSIWAYPFAINITFCFLHPVITNSTLILREKD